MEWADSGRGRIKTFKKSVLKFLSLTCGIIAISLYLVYQWGNMLQDLPEPVIVEFKPATSLDELANQLSSKKIVSSAELFSVWVRLYSDYRQFQAGLYRFSDEVSADKVAETFIDGNTYHPIVLKYTIPEGFTYKQFAERLVALGVGSSKEFKKLYRDKGLLKKNKITSVSLEGYIYPATYQFNKMLSAREAIEFALKTFWEKLPDRYEADLRGMNLTLSQAVTFASLIELETNIDDERPKVAEVIWRRLKNGEPLAIDASIIFGIKDFKGDLKWKHLADRSNRYNTRIHKGLPPSPIGSPSILSLKAVLNPTNQGYYYYVLDFENMTRHHFSKTLKEHNRYVRKLVERSRRKKQ